MLPGLEEFLKKPAGSYMSKELLVLDMEKTVSAAARVMRDKGLGSVLVAKDDKPIGIVTERDILNKVVASGLNSSQVKIGEVMSSPLISISPDTSVDEALATMARHNIRRLVVKERDNVVGVISQTVIVGDRRAEYAPLPDLDLPKGAKCPYCGSHFSDKSTLSKHIDRIHIGSGLLEGDTRRW